MHWLIHRIKDPGSFYVSTFANLGNLLLSSGCFLVDASREKDSSNQYLYITMFEVGRRGRTMCSLLPFISHWPKLGHIAHLQANHWPSGTATARMGFDEIWFIQLLEPWLPEQNCTCVSYEEGDIAVGQATNSICPKMQYPQAFERGLSQDHYSAGCSRLFFDLQGTDPFSWWLLLKVSNLLGCLQQRGTEWPPMQCALCCLDPTATLLETSLLQVLTETASAAPALIPLPRWLCSRPYRWVHSTSIILFSLLPPSF